MNFVYVDASYHHSRDVKAYTFHHDKKANVGVGIVAIVGNRMYNYSFYATGRDSCHAEQMGIEAARMLFPECTVINDSLSLKTEDSRWYKDSEPLMEKCHKLARAALKGKKCVSKAFNVSNDPEIVDFWKNTIYNY